MADIIESAHPEPYVGGGGKIAFNRRLQQTLDSIPEGDMTVPEFFGLLSPLVASVRDAHTALDPLHSPDPYAPGGIPLYFTAVEERLWVRGVPDEARHDLLGATLISVQGVPVDELLMRVGRLRGADNEYTGLASLGRTGYLWNAGGLAQLVPEWQDHDSIRIQLALPSGEEVERTFALPCTMTYPLKGPETSVDIPSTDKCDFVYDFLGAGDDIAFLRIDGMTGFREDFELEGTSTSMEGMQYAWERYHGTECPEDASEAIAGIPSATETFRALVQDMRARGTKTLIVDVTRNGAPLRDEDSRELRRDLSRSRLSVAGERLRLPVRLYRSARQTGGAGPQGSDGVVPRPHANVLRGVRDRSLRRLLLPREGRRALFRTNVQLWIHASERESPAHP